MEPREIERAGRPRLRRVGRLVLYGALAPMLLFFAFAAEIVMSEWVNTPAAPQYSPSQTPLLYGIAGGRDSDVPTSASTALKFPAFIARDSAAVKQLGSERESFNQEF